LNKPGECSSERFDRLSGHQKKLKIESWKWEMIQQKMNSLKKQKDRDDNEVKNIKHDDSAGGGCGDVVGVYKGG
jgi:hypothetical protein